MIPADYIIKKTVPTDNLQLSEFAEKGIEADVLSLDKIHPAISGNKWFKLKNYLQDASQKGHKTILTFGGAYSNHIVATACASNLAGLESIGIIRGEQSATLSHTLQAARQYGMQLRFISRESYRQIRAANLRHPLLEKFREAYMIPEGGQGELGIRGSEEILQLTQKNQYSHILCAIGTGTMFMGLVNSSLVGQRIIGISVLKGMQDLLSEFQQHFDDPQKINHCQIQYGYHFGGYAKRKPELIDFMNRLYDASGIATDFVYTAKMFCAATDLAAKNHFPPGSKLLLIHSGGLQGNESLPPGMLNF